MADEPTFGPKYSDSPYAPDWAKAPSERKTPPPKEETPENKDASAEGCFRPDVAWFEDLLWSEAGDDDDIRVYAIIDGFWAKGLYGRLRKYTDLSWAHMFQGGVALRRIQDAPFIIALKRGHALNQWLVNQGWGDGWGIYFTASTTKAEMRCGKTKKLPPMFGPSNEEEIRLGNLTEGLEDPLWLMRNHFRRFSLVEFEDDARVVRFRYFDPAVLRTYLPTCNDKELFSFFGPVKTFYAEGYNSVESLNMPHEIYRFRARMDLARSNLVPTINSSVAIVFEGLKGNIVVKRSQPVERTAAAREIARRDPSTVPMIRSGQMFAFKQHKIDLFRAEIVDVLLDMGSISQEYTQIIVSELMKEAKSYKLTQRIDVFMYVVSRCVFGDNFFRNTELVNLLDKNRKGLSVASDKTTLRNYLKYVFVQCERTK